MVAFGAANHIHAPRARCMAIHLIARAASGRHAALSSTGLDCGRMDHLARRLMLVLVVVLAGCGSAAPTGTPAPSKTPAGQAGAGGIALGMAISQDRSKLTAPSVTFPRGFAGLVWFIATFSEAPATPSLTMTLTRGSGADEATVWSRQIAVGDPGSRTFADGKTLPELDALEPSAYVMRIKRDATILAEGSFQID